MTNKEVLRSIYILTERKERRLTEGKDVEAENIAIKEFEKAYLENKKRDVKLVHKYLGKNYKFHKTGEIVIGGFKEVMRND